MSHVKKNLLTNILSSSPLLLLICGKRKVFFNNLPEKSSLDFSGENLKSWNIFGCIISCKSLCLESLWQMELKLDSAPGWLMAELETFHLFDLNRFLPRTLKAEKNPPEADSQKFSNRKKNTRCETRLYSELVLSEIHWHIAAASTKTFQNISIWIFIINIKLPEKNFHVIFIEFSSSTQKFENGEITEHCNLCSVFYTSI